MELKLTESKLRSIIRSVIREEFINEDMNNWIVNRVEYDNYGYGHILSIKLSNGYELVPDEDTGGEFALLQIKGTKLKRGDKISFDVKPDKNKELWGIERIYVNNKAHRAEVYSEGGNTSTYLVYQKS